MECSNCGDEVRELGPCVKCGYAKEEVVHSGADGLGPNLVPMCKYRGRLVHVTLLGPCVTEVLHTQWNGGYAPCGELEDCLQHTQDGLGHPYAPTVTERTDLDHDAEVGDGD